MTYIKAFLMLYIFLICSSCISGDDELKITNNRRVLVSGGLLDINGSGIPNIDVKSFGRNVVLGFSLTDVNGDFSFTSLKSNEPLIVAFNRDENMEVVDNGFSSLLYQVNDDLEVVLEDIRLKNRVLLNFTIVKINPDSQNLLWSLSYQPADCIIYLGDSQNTEFDITECGDTTVDIDEQNSNFPNNEAMYSVTPNTEVVFTYQIDDNEEESLVLNVTSENLNYVFEY